MQAPEYLTRRELADQLNIYFLGPVQSGRWPKTHSRLFADVQQLGKQEFEAYKESITVDSIVKPWRARTKLRAKKLATMGRKYRDEGIRERGWRLNIEPEVFQRFSAEVICPECRSRLWESDFNAAVDDLEPFAEALKRRRLKRTACECPENMGSNIYEPGINMIFSDRAEEAIKHVPPLRIKKPKRNQQDKEEPDRVYGLKQAGDFNFVLNSAAKSDPSKRLRDTIEISPFFEEREPLLFPFLIMEAKSSKQGDPAAVELQSAFCIRRLLLLQHNLKEKTGQETQWKTGPLVWFFHCYGERWTVAGCFVENVNGDQHYSIVDLWSGDIRNEDGAIQLLLIVDYIFDWARDIYRRSILNELNILASDDIADMVSVSDIYSTIERSLSARVDEAGRERSTQDSNVLYEEEATDSISKSLILIHPEGVVRDASIIESKFLALHITEDDVESFLLSFSTAESSYKAIHIILQLMQNAWRMDAGTLHDLKAHWTSDDSNEQTDRGYFDSQEIFYARIVILMHIGPEWQPVRQITYLAVSESALKLMASKVATNSMSSTIESIIKTAGKSSVPKQALLRRIDMFKEHSIVENLSAAVHTLCLSSTVQRRSGAIQNEFLLIRRQTAPFFGFVPENSPGVLDMVTTIYELHRIGRRPPNDSYLLYSCHKTKQTRQSGKARMWSHLKPLFVHRRGCILVDGLHQSDEIPKRCLYSIDGLSEVNILPELLEQLSREGCYYSTMPLDLRSRCGDYFGFLNQPPRATEFWNLRRDPKSIAVWTEFLKSQDSHKSKQPPIVIILDDEPATAEIPGEDMDIL